MKTRRSVLAAAALALVVSLAPFTPASAVAGPSCDPGWTEVAPVRVENSSGPGLPTGYLGSLCRGPSQAMNVRLNLAGMPSSGSYTFWFYENIGGTDIMTGKWEANLSPSSPIANSPTYVPGFGNYVRASVLATGVFSGATKTVTESVPTVVTTPKTAAQGSKAQRVRTKALKRAKSTYKAQVKLYKSKTGPGPKKAKRQYKRTVASVNATYRKAIAPTRTVVNVPTTRQEPLPPIGWVARGGYNLN